MLLVGGRRLGLPDDAWFTRRVGAAASAGRETAASGGVALSLPETATSHQRNGGSGLSNGAKSSEALVPSSEVSAAA